MTTKNLHLADIAGLLAGILLGCLFLFLLSGCSNAPLWGSWSKVPTKEQLAAVRRRAETYTYFTNYEVYHQPARNEYVYKEGAGWVTAKRPPPTVTVELLESSPQVELKLYDHPGEEHTQLPPRQ
ncbi:MAG TPA: hypothetical protein VG734_15380 [Lacunisphaera sp.]|nr:hypothetical protein [Lacunisphaera sp.]